MTKAELEEKLKQKDRIIEGLINEITNLNKQYKDIITRNEYNILLKQYNDLKQNYQTLFELYNNLKHKKHNERRAGRKSKLNDELITQIQKLKNENNMTIQEIAEHFNISVGLVHKALHTR
ncbi:Helix-turn-helix domain of resolvase [Caloramator quimbayensis]|uniref:Helix-turn-helix domain of resolvase n=1 Tax=Caloramator quimbayensis TaxID=1147123 RepID=A0A1T4YDK3_9CLOT|nr:helix-turn-helix domain-containing protein [Caloramator quimbayensis]SKA99917.1 Helix-turn-helix domain of resolvase [Caloramator quimbayensis]